MADMNVSLVLRLIDKATGPLKKFQRSVGAFSGQAANVKKSWQSASSEVTKLARNVTALAGVGGFLFKRELLDTAVQFERYNTQLEALTGSSQGAKQAMDWISDFARNTPTDIAGVVESFTKLKAFGLDPMDGTMQAIVDQTSKLGFSNEKLAGITLALGQAFTKQKLQGEEALQLMERGVPVWDLLAKATGKNVPQLQKLSRTGKLGRDAIRLLIQEMGKASQGAAAREMETLGGRISNIGDAWLGFKRKIIGAGLGQGIGTQLKRVLEWVERLSQNGKLDVWAKQTSDGLIKFGGHLLDTAKWLGRIGKKIWNVIEPLGGLKFAITAVALAMSYTSAVAIAELTVAFAKLGFEAMRSVVPALFKIAFWTAKTAVAITAKLIPAALKGTVALFRLAVPAIAAAAPFLALGAAIGGVGLAINQLVKNWKKLDVLEGFRGMWDSITESGLLSTMGQLFDPRTLTQDIGLIGSERKPATSAAASLGKGSFDINVHGPATVSNLKASGLFDMNVDQRLGSHYGMGQ